MSREQLSEEIQGIARDIFVKPELEINDAMGAADVDTWTSMSFMQFLTAVEDKYEFKFKMMEIIRLQTMGAVIDAVQKHIA